MKPPSNSLLGQTQLFQIWESAVWQVLIKERLWLSRRTFLLHLCHAGVSSVPLCFCSSLKLGCGDGRQRRTTMVRLGAAGHLFTCLINTHHWRKVAGCSQESLFWGKDAGSCLMDDIKDPELVLFTWLKVFLWRWRS